jgi:hypothetical protein
MREQRTSSQVATAIGAMQIGDITGRRQPSPGHFLAVSTGSLM